MARPRPHPDYSQTLEVDLSAIVPSIAGPKRPQDRIALADASRVLRAVLDGDVTCDAAPVGLDQSGAESFPASDPVAVTGSHPGDQPGYLEATGPGKEARPHERVPVTLEDGSSFEIGHGAVVIAATPRAPTPPTHR